MCQITALGGIFGLIVHYTQLKLNFTQKLKLPHNTASKSFLVNFSQIPLSCYIDVREQEFTSTGVSRHNPSLTYVLWFFRGFRGGALKLVPHGTERRYLRLFPCVHLFPFFFSLGSIWISWNYSHYGAHDFFKVAAAIVLHELELQPLWSAG